MESITSSKLFTTRQGTILLGVIAAVIAAIALLVYLNHYRNSVTNNAPIKVLVAKSLIPKGTPGDVVGTTGLYQITSYAKSQVKTGAFLDPSTLTGQVALKDVYPGQQLTSADFGPATNSVTDQLGRNQRAVVISLGSPQEVGGQITAGSHVDVYIAMTGSNSSGVTRPTVRELYQDMYVLNAPASGGGNVTLRANPRQAGTLIYASQNAEIWLVLRPTVGSKTKPPVITANALVGNGG